MFKFSFLFLILSRLTLTVILMNQYQQQRKQIIQLFQQVQSLVTQSDRKDIAKTLKESAERFTKGKLIVVVAGEFKQGKSSLINALINEKDLFPVDIDITTNLVSTITYGKEEKVTVVLGEPGKGKPKNITRAEISDYVTEQKNRRNQKQAQMLIIESPNPQLKEGLVLVDTPGVGGLNTEHTAVSYAFIPNADVVIFVSDTQKPLTVKELEFVEMINRHCQNFLFVITKKDIGNYQEIVDSNRGKLNKTLNCTEEAINLIPVSSKTKLAYLETKDEEDLEDSNFTVLETNVWQILVQQRGSILSLRALADLEQALNQVKTPLEVEWAACQQPADELAEIEQELQDVTNNLQSLLKNDAIWRTQLFDGLQEIRTQISENFQDKFAQITKQIKAYTENPSLLEDPEQIVSLLEVDIDSQMTDLGQELSYLADKLHNQIEMASGLNISISELSSLNNLKASATAEEIQFKKQTRVSKLMHVTRSATYNASAAATIGGLAGGVIGSFFGGAGSVPGYYIGAAIGGGLASIAGLVVGAKEGISQQQERNQASVSQAIRPFIADSQKQCIRALNKALKELERSMRDELKTQIQQEKETGERTLRSLKEAQKLTKDQTARKIAELKPLIQKIKYLEQQISKLAELALAQKEAASFIPTDEPSQKEQPETKSVTTVGVTASDVEDDENWADG